MLEQLTKIDATCLNRYRLTLPSSNQANIDYPKAYVNHMMFWADLHKIGLHCTSKTILTAPELYGSLSFVFSCASGQTPKTLKSKKSVAAFKVMAGALVGAKCSLRKRRLQAFRYKWAFLAAGVDLSGTGTGSSATGSLGLGLENVFIFELESLDYRAFEPLPGFDIQFDHRPYPYKSKGKSAKICA